MFHLGLLSTHFPYILIIAFYVAGLIWSTPECNAVGSDDSGDSSTLVNNTQNSQYFQNSCYWYNNSEKKISRHFSLEKHVLLIVWKHRLSRKTRLFNDTSFHPSFLTCYIQNRPPPYGVCS